LCKLMSLWTSICEFILIQLWKSHLHLFLGN
jgi:hypothetical protein